MNLYLDKDGNKVLRPWCGYSFFDGKKYYFMYVNKFSVNWNVAWNRISSLMSLVVYYLVSFRL